jgi:Transglutaminase-like superfamily
LRSATSKLRRFLDLPSSERLLLVKSAFVLVTVKAGLKLLSFRTVDSLLAKASLTPGRVSKHGTCEADQVVRSVNIASAYIPGVKDCLTRALAAQVLLARHGQPSTVRIGAGRDEQQKFVAHAWLICDGQVVLGDTELDTYSELMDIEREDL